MDEKLKSTLSEKAFAESFINCESEDEARAMLEKEGFSVTDEEMDAIADALNELAIKTQKMSPEEIEKFSAEISGGTDTTQTSGFWANMPSPAKYATVGIGALGVAGIATCLGVGIYAIGESQGWWKKKKKEPYMS